jgi:hypothetical protein
MLGKQKVSFTLYCDSVQRGNLFSLSRIELKDLLVAVRLLTEVALLSLSHSGIHMTRSGIKGWNCQQSCFKRTERYVAIRVSCYSLHEPADRMFAGSEQFHYAFMIY